MQGDKKCFKHRIFVRIGDSMRIDSALRWKS
jgi:hypothetical protein